MDTWTDIILLAGIAACTIISCGALLWAFMDWRERRAIRRARFDIGRDE